MDFDDRDISENIGSQRGMNDRAACLVDVSGRLVLTAGLSFGFPKGGKLRRAALDLAGVTPADPGAKSLADETGDHWPSACRKR